MAQYASSTTVKPEKSRQEIEATLKRYGATHFGYGASPLSAVIAFQANNRTIRFTLPLPALKDFVDYKHSRSGNWNKRKPRLAESLYDKACRQRWRALALAIKAKLEAVNSSISTFEEEFMAQIVLPNGQTMGEHALPYVEEAYTKKKMPPLLGFGL